MTEGTRPTTIPLGGASLPPETADVLKRLSDLGFLLAKVLEGKASTDEILALLEGVATWVSTEDPAMAPKLATVLKWLQMWRAMGPEGPFTPVPTWQPGPGPYRGR